MYSRGARNALSRSLRALLLRPRSHGHVTLRSIDPAAPVRITNNFLADPSDLATLRKAIRLAYDIAHQAPLRPFRGKALAPEADLNTDVEIDDWIRAMAITVNHP